MASSGAYIDPLGQFALVAKYQKALEKGKILGLKLEFTAYGQKALAFVPKAGQTNESAKADEKNGHWVSVVDAMASKSSTEEKPFSEEKKYLVSRYEVRLDEEAPAAMRGAADKSALEAAVAALPFAKRKALQMSNQEFEIAFLRWESGVARVRPAEQADALRLERASAKAGRGRGRGELRGGRARGGRGRGGFRGAEAPQAAPEGAA